MSQPDGLDFEKEFYSIAAQLQAEEAMNVRREATKAAIHQTVASIAVAATLAISAKYSLDTSYTPFHFLLRQP